MHGTNAPLIAPPTDQELLDDLLDRARTGDRAALDALIRKHANLEHVSSCWRASGEKMLLS
jgi:hypothetical protein